jgi:predicted AAA+ superfamily ATPase
MLTDNYVDALTKGFYPALYDRKIDPTVFYANYLQTYVERDVLQLLNVRNLTQFRTFILLCASRVGQLLNIANLANECQITQPTAKSWLSILESSYIIFLLPPYHKNFNKRLVKSPKLYFYDTGLVSHLLGVKTADELNQSLKGSLFENMIISEFLKQNEHQYLFRNFYFWRDSNGLEVDLMHINSGKINIFEIKSSSTITNDSFKGLKAFQEIAGTHIGQKTLIYAGTENQERTQYLVRAWCDKRLMSD